MQHLVSEKTAASSAQTETQSRDTATSPVFAHPKALLCVVVLSTATTCVFGAPNK